jgi:hypothetical protein
MNVMAAVLDGERKLAQLGAAFGRKACAKAPRPRERVALGTIPRLGDCAVLLAIVSGRLRFESRKIGFTSSGTSICRRRDGAIRKNVIGRGVSVAGEYFACRGLVMRSRRTFPLLHQPARQHGGGIFLDPKVEQRADLLAEIGSMAETREFVALQRDSRSGEKELPGRLGLVVVHAGLLVSGVRRLILH